MNTRKKSEIFSSILVRKKTILTIAGIEIFSVYDILCSQHFNPNERTGFVFSRNNPKFLLPEQLQRSIIAFYNHQKKTNKHFVSPSKKPVEVKLDVYVYQCGHCFTVYDPGAGEPLQNIEPHTPFENLPGSYCCPLCEAPQGNFKKIEKSLLSLRAI